ncbi:MAG: copper homeostasis protein CutC [Chitinophagaceae bacterium]
MYKSGKRKITNRIVSHHSPQGRRFFYSEDEFTIIKNDVRVCKELGCDGIVIGILTKDGKVDKLKCSLLVDYVYPLGVTFHRAFDRTVDPFQALEDIIDIGCERILTSGQMPTAFEGAELIKQLIDKADDRIIIMPGSGVRS